MNLFWRDFCTRCFANPSLRCLSYPTSDLFCRYAISSQKEPLVVFQTSHMGFFSFNLNILLNDRSTVGGHMSKKGPPNYCAFFTTGDCDPTRKLACFFPIIFCCYHLYLVFKSKENGSQCLLKFEFNPN